MEIFFSKMGITDLKFKPAYNPYTGRISLEVHVWVVTLWTDIYTCRLQSPV